ncbi:hypothetical protein [Bacillus toyonensis]|uniref:hypothetical protein n=1 Tax=Bacillus toyonensis TaxID=155322 RepID=UPI002E1E6F5F|nr:hypothetical protein [Bacillus toyonensis]
MKELMKRYKLEVEVGVTEKNENWIGLQDESGYLTKVHYKEKDDYLYITEVTSNYGIEENPRLWLAVCLEKLFEEMVRLNKFLIRVNSVDGNASTVLAPFIDFIKTKKGRYFLLSKEKIKDFFKIISVVESHSKVQILNYPVNTSINFDTESGYKRICWGNRERFGQGWVLKLNQTERLSFEVAVYFNTAAELNDLLNNIKVIEQL